ncbi:MAG: (d)CMP kinase [Solirubrobacterales bacterium]|nr:(d)CMP kinase [Solirubrobacterales bacterium]
MIIAIDGPAGAGKSTVSRAVAEALGATYLDSGAMYRVVAFKTLSGSDAASAARSTMIGLGEKVTADGIDVTELIRSPEVAARASEVAQLPLVRQALVEQQRKIMSDGRSWVAEGRDIGTVVAPGADLKIFLTADPEARAERRATELGLDAEAVKAEQEERDLRDTTRDDSPLVAAEDAIEIDTTGLSIDQVVARILELARPTSAPA